MAAGGEGEGVDVEGAEGGEDRVRLSFRLFMQMNLISSLIYVN